MYEASLLQPLELELRTACTWPSTLGIFAVCTSRALTIRARRRIAVAGGKELQVEFSGYQLRSSIGYLVFDTTRIVVIHATSSSIFDATVWELRKFVTVSYEMHDHTAIGRSFMLLLFVVGPNPYSEEAERKERIIRLCTIHKREVLSACGAKSALKP